MTGTILCINAGSSSIKFQLFKLVAGDELSLVSKGQIEGIGAEPRLTASDASGTRFLVRLPLAPQRASQVPLSRHTGLPQDAAVR